MKLHVKQNIVYMNLLEFRDYFVRFISNAVYLVQIFIMFIANIKRLVGPQVFPTKIVTYVTSFDRTFEPVHEISNNLVCATSKASDQPAHTRSLIRAFACRLSIL